jgi:hypothetical protein
MKWTKELDEKLKVFINLGKKYEEISIELGTSVRSISNRAFRLGLRLVFHTEFKCKQCEKLFISYINSDRVFCSKSCSATFNNLGKNKSNETKEKIALANKGKKHSEESVNKRSGKNNGNYIDGRSLKYTLNKKDKINNKRKCKYCGGYKIEKKHKAICDDCRIEYYEGYRPSCEFNFDIKKYKDKFDLQLVEEYGWYSPTNKGNNLNGVSRDHMYSVRDGFINKIDPEIIKHPANCKLMKHSDNNFKNHSSTITLDELLERINNW